MARDLGVGKRHQLPGSHSPKGRLSQVMREYYRRARSPVAVGLVAAAVLGIQLSIKGLQEAGLGGIALLMLETIFDIQRMVADKNPDVLFDNFFNACETVWGEVERRSAANDEVRIRVFGVSLKHYGSWITRLLETRLNAKTGRIHVSITLLDSEWTQQAGFNPEWVGYARLNLETMAEFYKEHRAQFEAKGWSFKLSLYAMIPGVHGILIDDDYLLTGTFRWNNGRMTGAENKYELIRASDSPMAVERIDEFVSWHNEVERTGLIIP